VSLFPDTEMVKGATLSECGLYRYRLWRTWDSSLRSACFIALNPSTADASVDDPTVRRCVGFARSWGCGGLVVVNLFAYRATEPKALFDVYYRRQFAGAGGEVRYHNGDPVGPENDAHVRKAAEACHPVVAAWGVHGVMMLRDGRVKKLLADLGTPVVCLGLTHDGHPRHPLYVRADADLVPFGRTP
jgi:hypothetical protein